MSTAANSIDDKDGLPSEPRYFVVVDGRRSGPLDAESVRAAGVTRNSWIWREGLAEWVRAGELSELQEICCDSSRSQNTGDRDHASISDGGVDAQASAELGKSWLAKSALMLALIIGLGWLPAIGPSPATLVVWLMTAGATVSGYFVFRFVTTEKRDRPSEQIAVIGIQRLFTTAIVGCLGLLLFQRVAITLAGTPTGVSYGSTTATAAVWITKIIGYAYGHAFPGDSEQGFWATLIAMLCSVAICEEFLKLLPVAYLLSRNKLQRTSDLMFVAALAGLGFGIGEGVFYSYMILGPNEAPFSMYIHRFFGIALAHGVLTMLGAIVLNASNSNSALADFQEKHRDRDIVIRTSLCALVPAVPHAFYNTFLSQGMGFLAGTVDVLLIAFIGLWLAMHEQASAARSSGTT